MQNLLQTTLQDSFFPMRSILPVAVAMNTLMMIMIQKPSPKQLLTLVLNTKLLSTHYRILASPLAQSIIRTSSSVRPHPNLLFFCPKICPSRFVKVLLHPHSLSHQAHHPAFLHLQEQQPPGMFQTFHRSGNLHFDAESRKS